MKSSAISAVIVPHDGRVLPAVVWNGWSTLKAEQQLADGTSARIDADRECRLAQMPSQLPRPALRVVEDEETATVAIIHQRALAKIRAHIARNRADAQGGAA